MPQKDQSLPQLEYFDARRFATLLESCHIYVNLPSPDVVRVADAEEDLRNHIYRRIISIIHHKLRPSQREVLSMVFFFDLTERESAAVFKINHYALQCKLQGALKRLRKKIACDRDLNRWVNKLRELGKES